MKAKVLIILPTDKFLQRQILEGILDYGHTHGPWQFNFETGDRYEQGLGRSQRWGCTGIIAMVWSARQLAELAAIGVPAVFLNPPVNPESRRRPRPPAHAVYVRRDQENVGRTAAEYFLVRGYKRLAFVGSPQNAVWSQRRLDGFRQRIAEAGGTCAVYETPPEAATAGFDLEAQSMADWLGALPPGTALYAVTDRRALQVLGICADLGITVPDTLAVLGTDNDVVLCESVTPSLSSISLDGRNVGQLCARLLDRLLHGEKVEPLVDLAYPRIETRQSTDALLITDPFIARAIALVRHDLSVTHSIAEIAASLGVSKRTLEMKANLILGHTLKDEIRAIRLNEAVQLLSNTSLSVQAIAERCGFCGASHLSTRFRAAFGYSPSVFRYQDPK